MEYQETINLLGNTPNQSKKSMTKNWVEINDDACGTYNTNTPIKFKTSMLGHVYVIIVTHTYLLKEL